MKLTHSNKFALKVTGNMMTIYYNGQYAGLKRSWDICQINLTTKETCFPKKYESKKTANIKLLSSLFMNPKFSKAQNKLSRTINNPETFLKLRTEVITEFFLI